LWAARKVGDNGLVIAIEPDPINYIVLLKNVKLNNFKNIIALRIAAYSSKTKLRLFKAHVSSHHSVVYTRGAVGAVTVDALPIDSVLRDLGVKKCDFVKIDAEGAEF